MGKTFRFLLFGDAIKETFLCDKETHLFVAPRNERKRNFVPMSRMNMDTQIENNTDLSIVYNDERLKEAMSLSTADLRFVDAMTRVINANSVTGYCNDSAL